MTSIAVILMMIWTLYLIPLLVIMGYYVIYQDYQLRSDPILLKEFRIKKTLWMRNIFISNIIVGSFLLLLTLFIPVMIWFAGMMFSVSMGSFATWWTSPYRQK